MTIHNESDRFHITKSQCTRLITLRLLQNARLHPSKSFDGLIDRLFLHADAKEETPLSLLEKRVKKNLTRYSLSRERNRTQRSSDEARTLGDIMTDRNKSTLKKSEGQS